ncbi:phospholysine phosphohistidine inorganic pyrophosphate phosphatase-like [Macrosteles quadrilineatus]|uniref:phospholysine phosphohistidine inorganic pyrophosphate phosphatase-like n=1 Tax=Macrosteles quadrilineatus TaxID=74068 RepID=UPI0023E24E0E|nr:phospholysine phosphohistidine inorganic pyrophosphate phosphatase-like [Macrosteles quadrilineatus]
MGTDWLKKPIKGLLLDISGVLKNGDEVVNGSLIALEKLRFSKLPFRLVTNETQSTKAALVKELNKLGFNINEEEVFAPVPVVVKMLEKNKLRPFLLVHKQVLKEFKDIETSDPNCVVIGDAGQNFTFDNLNKAFRLLIDLPEPVFFSLGSGKYYKEKDGLTLDVGAFAKALEFSSGVKPRVIGKPDPTFFLAAVEDMNLSPSEVVMIGDDIESDVGGAQACGLRGVLVKTGKFRPGDESHPRVKPDAIVINLYQAVEMVLNSPETLS